MRHSRTIIFTFLSLICLILGTTVFRGAALESTGFSLLALFLCPLFWKLFRKKVLSAPLIIVCALTLLFQTQYNADTNTWTINKEFALNQTQSNDRNVPETTAPESSGNLSDLEVHYIDIGQGDATLITSKGQSLLIDAGENDKGTAVQLYLKKQNIEKLDYVIATHPDSDHIGASYQLGDATFTIIAPNRSYGDNTNDWSVGILLTHGKNRFIFTGDAEWDAEYDILGNGIDISCDVYKVGHHGSESSTTKALLDAMTPTYAVISCGKGNKYGHPRDQILNRLKERNIQIFRTDQQGSIIARSNGATIQWTTQMQKEASPKSPPPAIFLLQLPQFCDTIPLKTFKGAAKEREPIAYTT